MNKDAIIFAMANPEPEILPDLAKEAGAAVVGTGRSDYPNQINNVLIFPGLFKGALAARAKRITEENENCCCICIGRDHSGRRTEAGPISSRVHFIRMLPTS